MVSRLVILATLATFACPSAGAAQERLSLQQAVGATLANNPDLRAARAAQRESAAHADEAVAAYLPRVDLVEAWQRGNNPVFVFGSLLAQQRFTAANFALDALNHPDPLTNYHGAIMVDQPVFDTPSESGASVRPASASRSRPSRSPRPKPTSRWPRHRAYGEALQASAGRAAASAAVAAARGRSGPRRTRQGRRDGDRVRRPLAARAPRADAGARDSIGQRPGHRDRSAQPPDGGAARPGTDPGGTGAGSHAAPDAGGHRAGAAAGPSRAEASDVAAVAGRKRPERPRKAAFLPAGVPPGACTSSTAIPSPTGPRPGCSPASCAGTCLRGAATPPACGRPPRPRPGRTPSAQSAESGLRLEAWTTRAQLESATAREAVGRTAVLQARESQRIIRDRYEAGLAGVNDVLRAANALLDAETLRISSVVDVMVAKAAYERSVGMVPAAVRPAGPAWRVLPAGDRQTAGDAWRRPS